MSLFARKKDPRESRVDEGDHTLFCPENLRKLFYIVVTARYEDFQRAVAGKGIQISAAPGSWDAEAQAALRLIKIGNYDPYQVLSMFDLEGLRTLAFAYGLRLCDEKEEQLNELLLSLFGENRPDSGYNAMLEIMRKRDMSKQDQIVNA